MVCIATEMILDSIEFDFGNTQEYINCMVGR